MDENAVPLAVIAAQIQSYLYYLGSAFALLALFSFIYTSITRYNEWKLLKEGNTAAAASFSGAMLGFSCTIFMCITTHAQWLSYMAWASGAMLIQILAYVVMSRFLMPGLDRAIMSNNTAKGIFMGTLSLCIGIINAACLV